MLQGRTGTVCEKKLIICFQIVGFVTFKPLIMSFWDFGTVLKWFLLEVVFPQQVFQNFEIISQFAAFFAVSLV